MGRCCRTIAVVLSVTLLAAACSGDDDATEAAPAPTSEAGGGAPTSTVTSSITVAEPPAYDFSAAADAIDGFVLAEGLNGAGLTIVHRDEGVIFEHYAGDFDAERISLIASSSKMITAGVLMRLHDEGVLDVDAPVADLAEWGSGHPEVTPVQLISNSSGLVGLGPDPTFAPYLCQYTAADTMQDCAEQIFTTADDDDQVIPPDTEFRYGGGQWQVAGAVAEVASGKSWAELIDETYVEPCGLDTLGYNNHYSQIVSTDGPFNHPESFDSDPSTLAATDNPNMEGGAYINAGDYGALLLMHLRDGMCGDERVLSEASVDRMHADRIGPTYDGDTDSDLEGYGLGWWVDQDDPGFVQDGGAFGSLPWLDLGRGYGAYLVVERTNLDGRELGGIIRPLIDAEIDAHQLG